MSERVLRGARLTAAAGVEHAFETRHGNLQEALPAPVARVRQVHGADVMQVADDTDLSRFTDSDLDALPAADALVTALTGVTVAVATADCVPVLLADARIGVVGAAHAGWRGLALGVLPATVAVMAREYGARPDRMAAAVGPRVGADAYRVGNDVRVAFRAAGLPEEIFRPAENDEQERATWWCDLGAAARLQLQACGLPNESIDVLDACTVRDADAFWSYRRQGDRAGRMLSGVCLAPA